MNDQSQTLIQDFVYALAVDKQSDRAQIWYAARQSGLYQSLDNGSSWQSAYASLELNAPLPTTCLALAPGDKGESYLFAGVPGHVMRSENGGKAWQATPLTFSTSVPTTLAISADFLQDGTLLVGTNEDGVLRSTDRGLSWASWNFGLVDLNVLSLVLSPAFAQDQTVFAGTGSGLFYSQTGGKSWKELRLPAGFVAVLSLAISPNFDEDGTLLVGTDSEGLFISHDRGESWQRIGEKEIQGMVNQLLLAPDFPTTGEVIIAHEYSVLRSSDEGKTWSLLLEAEIASLAFLQEEPGRLSILAGMIDGSVKKI